jgi:hypothetical protein
MDKSKIAEKEIEVAKWMQKKGYDRRAYKEVAPMIVEYLTEFKLLDLHNVNRCASQIPTTWLDPLLTGKDAALTGEAGKWGCPDIENLLRAIKDRIIKHCG